MKKVYLAARYSRREGMLIAAYALKAAGITVTSRWIAGGHQVSGSGLNDEQSLPAMQREKFAQEDIEDLAAADTVISFTEEPHSNNSRGGRHVEFGMAVALGKRVIVIGPRENVFHCLPHVEVYPDFASFFETVMIPGENDNAELWGSDGAVTTCAARPEEDILINIETVKQEIESILTNTGTTLGSRP